MSDLDWEFSRDRHQMLQDEIRFEVWNADRSGWTVEDNRLHTFWMNSDPELLPMWDWPFDGVTIFEKGNLKLSWGSMAAILHLDEFPVKPQLVLSFANEDLLHLEPDWAKVAFEKQVLILRYIFKLCENGISDPQVELNRLNRHNFMHHCFLAVNAICNFVDLETKCKQCGQERQVHVLIACDGSRKSVPVLLVCMIFFGKFSCKEALTLLFRQRKSLSSLVESVHIVDALFEFEDFLSSPALKDSQKKSEKSDDN